MPGILIKNATFLNETGDFLVSKDNLTRVDSYDYIIDGTGLLIVPAFIDHHVHFRDPGATEKEDLTSGARSAAAGGYYAVECEPNTQPVIDDIAKYTELTDRIEKNNFPIDIRPKCAVTIDQLGDTLVDIQAFLNDDFPYWVHFSSDGEPVLNRDLLVRAFRLVDGWVRIDLHCEATPRSQNAITALFGSHRDYTYEPELIQLAISAIGEASIGHLHIQHISMAKSVDLIAAAKRQYTGSEIIITAEVTPHHLLLCSDDIPVHGGKLDANWKMNPPLRSRNDMMALRHALADGTIDFIATDHAPHSLTEKALPWEETPFGVIGLETAFGVCMSLVHDGTMSFSRLVNAMSGVDPADEPFPLSLISVSLIDPNHVWTVDPDKFYSKSRNCPFAGMTFKGKPMYTIASGKLIMADGEVLF